jgi:putative ABC transport system permease protein
VELSLAFRRVRRAPVFLGVSVATLGLAIGLNAGVFSIADAVLFRPLPYAEPGQLYFLRFVNRQTGRASSVAPRELIETLEARGGGITGITFRGLIQSAPHTGPVETELIGHIGVAPNFLNALGVRPLLGRPFDSSDLQKPGRAVLLTYSCWQNRFRADRRAIGQSVMLAGYQREVVGVLPPDFIFPSEGLSYPFEASGRPRYEFLSVTPAPRGRAVDPLVRLRLGVTPTAAQSEIESVARSLVPGLDPTLLAVRPILFPAGTLTLRILLLAAGFVLLLGCANLSHLFLIRVQERLQEVRLCLALGATRLHIARTLFLEALIVGLCGALVALVIAVVSFSALQHQVPTALTGGALMGVDWRVALFALILGALSAVLFTVLPAWTLATVSVQGTLLSGRTEWLRRGAIAGFGTVVLQAAVAMMLAALAIAAARHVVGMLRAPLGFSPESVVIVDSLPPASRPLHVFYAETVRRLAERSEVASAGAVEALPLSGNTARDNVPVAGAAGIPLVGALPGYFETAGIRLLRGRLFNSQDSGGPSPAIVSESAASILFPGIDPLGEPLKSENAGPFTVVGVVGDVKMTPARPHDPLVYTIIGPTFDVHMDVIARLRDSSPQGPAEIRRFVSSLEHQMPVTTKWWSESIDRMAEYRTPRFQTIILGTVAALATALAAIGLFGVVSYSTRRRMQEVAIRLALGAMPESITRRFAVRMAWPVGIGLLLGLASTWVMGRVLTSELVGFRAWDWPVLAAGTVVIASTAMLSSYVPLRRASRLSVMTVLKSQ